MVQVYTLPWYPARSVSRFDHRWTKEQPKIDGIKYPLFTCKSIWLWGGKPNILLMSNQDQTEKFCAELLFGIKVIAMNSYQL